MRMILFITALLLLLSHTPAQAADAMVAVSIKPIHSLVTRIMDGDAEPLLIVEGNASPHQFSLKPSQVKSLSHAAVVFYIDDDFELFLGRIFETLPKTTQRVALAKSPGITLLTAAAHDEHEEEEAHDHHGHHHDSAVDLHIWTDPKNAIAMARQIETTLSAAFPEKRNLYKKNADQLVADLSALDSELNAKLTPLKAKPFIVFHEAYRYFTHAYGLDNPAAITKTPEQLVSAKHLSEVKALIKERHIQCVLSEPGMDVKVAKIIGDDKKIKSAVIDVEGIEFLPEKDLYFKLMRSAAEKLAFCVSE